MSMHKQLERMRRMHGLIKFHRTGTPEQFAERLGISHSMLYRVLGEMKAMGAPIHFCHQRQTYAYYEPVDFRVEFARTEELTGEGRGTQSAGARLRTLPGTYPNPNAAAS